MADVDADYKALYPTGKEEEEMSYDEESGSDSFLFESDADDEMSDDAMSGNGAAEVGQGMCPGATVGRRKESVRK